MNFDFITSWFRSNLVTSPGKDTSRIRVDQGQTGFWEGREFRFDLEITAPIVVKFSSPVDFILQAQTLESRDGLATFTAYVGADGTPGGGLFLPAGLLTCPITQ